MSHPEIISTGDPLKTDGLPAIGSELLMDENKRSGNKKREMVRAKEGV